MDRRKLVEQILTANKDALSKVRELVHLGMDEEDADDMVEQYQIGQSQPVYYERLDFDYEE